MVVLSIRSFIHSFIFKLCCIIFFEVQHHADDVPNSMLLFIQWSRMQCFFFSFLFWTRVFIKCNLTQILVYLLFLCTLSLKYCKYILIKRIIFHKQFVNLHFRGRKYEFCACVFFFAVNWLNYDTT